MADIKIFPVLPLRALTIFPDTSVSIDVVRRSSINAIKYAVDNKSKIVVVGQKDPNVSKPKISELYNIGTLVDINKIMKVDENSYRILIDGYEIVELLEDASKEGFLSAKVVRKPKSGTITEIELMAYKTFILSSFDTIEEQIHRKFPKHIRISIEEADSPQLLFNISTGLLTQNLDKQKLLEEPDIKCSLDLLCEMMSNDLAYAKALFDIESKVQNKIAETNKDYLLREQIKSIQEELGDNEENVVEEYKEKIENLNAADEIKEKLNKDLDRFSRMNETAPESAIIRNYLDWVLDLPWDNMTEDSSNLKNVMDILNEDHYGIDKVKKRIVEYLAVRIMTKGASQGTALCLVGPPGVGKTSIAKSIAKALNKDYVQLTLGGVHDEAEIRGHRKTYIGAMPGRIMSSLAKAKHNNPLFLLDEVDKITRDMRGDPSAALLEVLDPNQNKTFRDNYLEIPYDLSNVMFVLTANDISELDKPLLDRLEIIEMEGYTIEEKIVIASKYLLPKQIIEHGLAINKIALEDDVIREIIEGYTRESGVRELERKLAQLCRKIAYNIVMKANGDLSKMVHKKKEVIKKDMLVDLIGTRTFPEINEVKVGTIGRVTGLAWTSVGGTTLDIEVCTMPGKGDLKLTGKLGDVMKESAITALSVVRARATKFGVKSEFFAERDIHIHVPKGATPKDGPSAGITISVALMSAVANIKVRDNIAMTGEINLNGDVLAIGGLKEKALAGHRVGVKTILIPYENAKDLEEIPDSIKKDVNFITVKNIEEVYEKALEL